MSRQNLSGLASIGEKAVELFRLEETHRLASKDLSEATREFRMEHCAGSYVQRDTEMHERMCEASALEFTCYQETKRHVRNAKRRLDTAIRAYLKGGVR